MKWQWQRKGHEQLKATQLSHANSRLFSKVTRAGRDKVSLNSLLKKKKKWWGEGEAELFAANRSMFLTFVFLNRQILEISDLSFDISSFFVCY